MLVPAIKQQKYNLSPYEASVGRGKGREIQRRERLSRRRETGRREERGESRAEERERGEEIG